jgi:dephospho-CoA kinase
VRRRMEERLAALRAAERADGRRRVAVLDVPLLAQTGWDAACDRLVVVACDAAVRQARLAARGWRPEQIAARDRAWERAAALPTAAAEKTTTVDAAADPAYTEAMVGRIWESLSSS